MLHLARAYEYLIFLDVATVNADLSHATGGEQTRTYHPVGVRTQVLLRGVLAGEAHDEHLAKDGRLRTEHRSAYSCRHLFAHGSKLFAYYLAGKIDVGAPIEFHPYYGEAVGGLRADTTYAGTAVDGGLNGEGDELLHFLCGHAASLGHDDHGGRIEVREHVDIGLAGGIESGDDKQHGRHQHKYSVLKREAYYLIQHSY